MKRSEKGFTLIELIVAVAIICPTMLALTMTTLLLLEHHERGTNHNIVLSQVQNAGHWISHDIQMAGTVTCGESAGFPLILNIPVDTSDDTGYDVHYLFNDGKIMRQTYDSFQNLTSEAVIANYIDIEDTSFCVLAPRTYQLTVKAAKGEAAIERNYEVSQRLGSS
jgi:prepilin-type N-terminal cleavage/methylation domain-containing protein